MGENCLECDKDRCLSCTVGYKPDKDKCTKIDPNCGDGLHSLSEQCDNAILTDGCDKACKIQSGYNCILEKNEGPDLCYKLEPLQALPFTDRVHFSSLFLRFTRPL